MRKPDDYIAHVVPVQAIQRQISQESYGAPHKGRHDEENIFDLAKKAGEDSLYGARGPPE